MTVIGDYLATLTREFGAGWNRFWFTPADVSTLGAIRLGAGLVLLYWLATFTPDLTAYFGPDGLAPQSILRNLEEPVRDGRLFVVPQQVRESLPRPHRWSLLNLLHTPKELMLGHTAALVIALLFAVGLFTRVTTPLALLVLLSYIHRGPVFTSQVEPILAFVMLYLCFGPAGKAWSFDHWLALRRHSRQLTAGDVMKCRKSSAAAISLRLIQVHLALVYALMAIGKLSSPVWWQGTGVWWLIARADAPLVDLTGLHSFPHLVSIWTYAVVLWQATLPILIWHPLARPLLLVVNAIMWGLLAPVTGLLDCALMMVIASLAFVPRVGRHDI
ncbi:MAG TPA: hypothetical protein VJ783_11845 [Pirellulales bacterium]|nr:hypothetical protein [Pirellulales bacterium]